MKNTSKNIIAVRSAITGYSTSFYHDSAEINQREAADLMGISQPHFARIEKQAVEKFLRILESRNIRVTDLL